MDWVSTTHNHGLQLHIRFVFSAYIIYAVYYIYIIYIWTYVYVDNKSKRNNASLLLSAEGLSIFVIVRNDE